MDEEIAESGGRMEKGQERLGGRISEWVEERGFGWVEYEGGSLFAHIREFRKGRVPVKGDEVTFVPGLDPRGLTPMLMAQLIVNMVAAMARSAQFAHL